MNFKEICRAIKEVRIQGAENIAIAALKAAFAERLDDYVGKEYEAEAID